MGKRYYCDYCERSFADGAENRKKHLVCLSHQKLRKAHYDMFKDAATLLREDKIKKPCRKFQQAGFCEFGSGCKYSHMTPVDIQHLEEQAHREKLSSIGEPKIEPDINKWLQTKITKMKQFGTPVSDVAQPLLPPALANVPNLPPSLIPPTISDFQNKQMKNIQEWG